MASDPHTPSKRRRRSGAGRPPGSGPYGETTRVVRIPQSLVPAVQGWLEQYRRGGELPSAEGVYRHASSEQPHLLPLYASRISAGWPSPADDYVEDMLDLQKLLVQHPAATFYLRVTGDSMSGAAIMHGDILVVDRSVEPAHGRIVVASIDNELTVKRLHRRRHRLALIPENPAYQPIEITEETDFRMWGVVTGVIRQV